MCTVHLLRFFLIIDAVRVLLSGWMRMGLRFPSPLFGALFLALVRNSIEVLESLFLNKWTTTEIFLSYFFHFILPCVHFETPKPSVSNDAHVFMCECVIFFREKKREAVVNNSRHMRNNKTPMSVWRTEEKERDVIATVIENAVKKIETTQGLNAK